MDPLGKVNGFAIHPGAENAISIRAVASVLLSATSPTQEGVVGSRRTTRDILEKASEIDNDIPHALIAGVAYVADGK